MLQALIALDQFVNTLIDIEGDGKGFADETISARAFRLYLQGVIDDKLYKRIDKLFFWDKDHCYTSWVSERDRKHLPQFYRIDNHVT